MNGVERQYGDYTSRAVTLADVDRVIDLINVAALADTGMMDTNRDEKLNAWGLPQFDLETDTLLVLAPDGQVVAFAELWDFQPHVRQHQWGRVHPEHRDQGLGGYLVDWAENRARQSIGKAPPQARVSLSASTVHGNGAVRDLFRGRGFAPVRHFYRMLVEMAPDRPPSGPVWPEPIAARPYVQGQDDRAVFQVMKEAFRDHWGYVEGETFEEWLHWIEHDPTFDPTLCFLAVAEDDQIAGVLMARPHWDADPTIAWIDELAVLQPWRRRGIALALLRQSFGEFHRRGRYRVGLAVDGNSLTGATTLYEKAGMHVFQQRDTYEKVLRPGKDLSTQSLD
jgi:mycothiol synthase